MATLNYFLGKPAANGEALILLQIRYQKNRLKFSTRKTIHPEFWDEENQCALPKSKTDKKKPYPDHKVFNNRLQEIKIKVEKTLQRYEDDDKPIPNPAELKTILKEKFQRSSEAKKDLFSFIEKFIEQSKTKVNETTGKIFSDGTIRNYRNTYAELKDFAKHRGSFSFENIDLDFYHEWKEYLSSARKVNRLRKGKTIQVEKEPMSLNTAGKHIKTLKTFLNEATEEGWNTNIKFRSKRFRTLQEESESISLNEAELQTLFDLDLSDKPHLERSRDLFIVGCWTGLRYSDLTNIEAENIQGNMIEIKTQKTSQRVTIPLHSMVKSIMNRYAGITANSLPPAIDNVNLNINIKEVCKLHSAFHQPVSISITKGGQRITETYPKAELVTVHTARRSFATNLYKQGLHAYTIMQITGHKTEKNFLKYIKVSQREHAQILMEHWNRIQMQRVA